MERNDVLTVDVVAEPDALWVRLGGELDVSTARMLEASVPAWPAGPGGTPVVVDLRGVTFCDGAGLEAIARVRRAAGMRGAACHVVFSMPVRQVAEASGLDRLLQSPS